MRIDLPAVVERRWPAIAAWCGLAFVWALSITGDSLWIDELTTAMLAGASRWGDFIYRTMTVGSEIYMPLFSVYAWIWGRFVGTSELTLRLMNLPWALLTAMVWWWYLRRHKLSPWWLLLLTSPFYCYYLNEARPYCMSFAAALVALCAVDAVVAAVRRREPAGTPEAVLTIAVGTSLGISMMNLFLVPILGIYGIALCVGTCDQVGSWRAALDSIGDLARSRRPTFIKVSVLMIVFLAYYGLVSLLLGGGKRGGYTVTNFMFGCFEIMGLVPFGPPRYAMRDLQITRIIGNIELGGWIIAACWLAASAAILRGLARRPRDPSLWAATLSFVCSLVLFIAAALSGDYRLWGRHMMCMIPVLFMLVAHGVQTGTGKPARAVLLIVMLPLLVWGSLRLRFIPDYGKDPFREAMAQVVNRHSADPIPTVWVAYRPGMEYYASKYGAAPPGRIPGWLRNGSHWDPTAIRAWNSLGMDYYLLLHRPDIFDPTGAWAAIAKSGAIIWELRGMRLFHIKGRRGT